MDLAQLTVSRRTVHSFKSDPVPDAFVEDALALSLWAPNHKLTFPWRYIWLSSAPRQLLGELSVEIKSQAGELSEIKKKALRDNMSVSSHLIVLATMATASPQQAHEDYATLSCSVQIASLALWQKGVATKWSTGGALMSSRTYEILGLSPAEYKLEGGLMIGYPASMPASPKRPPLEQFLKRI